MHSTIVKKIIPLILITLIGTSCNGWTVQPLPYNPPTPFVLPTRTPAVFSPTPVIIGVTSASATPVVPADTITPTFLPYKYKHAARHAHRSTLIHIYADKSGQRACAPDTRIGM